MDSLKLHYVHIFNDNYYPSHIIFFDIKSHDCLLFSFVTQRDEILTSLFSIMQRKIIQTLAFSTINVFSNLIFI